MKKRIIAFLAMLIICATFLMSCSCNYQFFDTNYSFTNAYVKIGDEWVDVEVEMWADYDGEQLQLTLKDGTVMVVNSVNCILYNGTLPKGE